MHWRDCLFLFVCGWSWKYYYYYLYPFQPVLAFSPLKRILVSNHLSQPYSPSPRLFRTSTSSSSWMDKNCRMSERDEDGYIWIPKENYSDEPYSYLEEVESTESLEFATKANNVTLEQLGHPNESPLYQRILSVLESQDRIPYVSYYGTTEEEDVWLYNLWKDSNHTKGIWRRTTMSSYETKEPEWETVLDIDELSDRESTSWVWKGAKSLPPQLDPTYTSQITRSLIHLSRGGADATMVREFDHTTKQFVTKDGFVVPEAKTRISYKSRNCVLIGTDFGPNSLTDSGYPRIIKEWKRGTPLEDATTIFQGQSTDVSVFAYINDQRHIHQGPIYQVHGRSLTFYTTQYHVKVFQDQDELQSSTTLTNNDDDDGFQKVNVPLDASIDFVGHMMLISLRSNWTPNNNNKKEYKAGSLLYVNAKTFLQQNDHHHDIQILFEPNNKTVALETYTVVKDYIILNVKKNVQSSLQFYQITPTSFQFVYQQQSSGKNRNIVTSAMNAPTSNQFWYTTSGYTQPSSLHLADATKVTPTSTTNDNDEPFVISKLKSLPDMYDSSNLIVTQKFATSKDGTSVPYFIVTSTETQVKETPTLLYGYGGFEISLGPKYIASVGAAWLERGGAYVEACIRGGGEYGPSWHQVSTNQRIYYIILSYI